MGDRSSVLIYTSLLALRGVMHCFPIVDCFITRYAILLITQSCVYKVDFVGRVESQLQLAKEMYILVGIVICRICGDTKDSILAVADADGNILLIDAILNAVLTKIPTGKQLRRVFFSTDATSMICVSNTGEVLFYPLNNCLNPTLPEGTSTSTMQSVKSKLLNLFTCSVCYQKYSR